MCSISGKKNVDFKGNQNSIFSAILSLVRGLRKSIPKKSGSSVVLGGFFGQSGNFGIGFNNNVESMRVI